MRETVESFLRIVMGFLAVSLAYLQTTWETVLYLYEPILATKAIVAFLLCLLLRIFLGSIGGWTVRTVVYGGLFYALFSFPQFRTLYPAGMRAGIIAAIMIIALWLPATLVGGLVRKRVRRLPDRTIFSPREPGKPFDVARLDPDTRKVMAIMMTDIVGYSAKMEKDEAATYSLLKAHNAVMRKAIALHRGREIKTIGDAFMVVFKNSQDALQCAITMQNELYAFNKPRLVHDQLKVRIGVHLGEVITTAKDVFGEGVNIAARIESITEPGGISISADAYEQVKGKVEAGFLSIGTPKMKNIAKPPEVFRVHLTH